jgi:uncharacterized membrane protein YhaH (DUF805 family)
MEFWEYFKQPLRQYAGFDGRTARKDFWMFVLISFLVSVAIGIVETLIVFVDGFGLTGLYSLAILIPSLAITVRRLHDTGKSAWWILIGMIPLVGHIIIIIFCASRGDDKENAFGSVPTTVESETPSPDGIRDAEVLEKTPLEEAEGENYQDDNDA